MFRLFIGCLAVVGLVTLLIIGGCVGLIAFGVKKGMEIPERARAQRIEAAHGALLAELRQRLGRPDGLAGMRRPANLVAIRVRTGADDDKEVDLLGMRPLPWRWHSMVNGGGLGVVEVGGRELTCLIYALRQGAQEYWIYILDQPPAQQVERA